MSCYAIKFSFYIIFSFVSQCKEEIKINKIKKATCSSGYIGIHADVPRWNIHRPNIRVSSVHQSNYFLLYCWCVRLDYIHKNLLLVIHIANRKKKGWKTLGTVILNVRCTSWNEKVNTVSRKILPHACILCFNQ